MAGTFAKTEIIGFVGKAPRLITMEGGDSVLNFNLATDRSKDSETPDWHPIAVWGKYADALAPHITKGTRLYVAGRLVNNNWTDDKGTKHWGYRINADQVLLLGSRKEKTEEAEEVKEAPKPKRRASTTSDRILWLDNGTDSPESPF